MIRYQQAEAMIHAKQFDRAVGMLEIGDNSGDDPSSLGNRYLLAVALQSMKRDEEALQTLDDLERRAASETGRSRRVLRRHAPHCLASVGRQGRG